MTSYAAERMTRFREVSDVARRIITGLEVGFLTSGWGVMTDSRIMLNSFAFLPVPIWDTDTHALAASSVVIGGYSGTSGW